MHRTMQQTTIEMIINVKITIPTTDTTMYIGCFILTMCIARSTDTEFRTKIRIENAVRSPTLGFKLMC